MKKFVLGLVFAGLLAAPVEAASLPTFNSAATNEPSQINATLNAFINSINGGVNSSSMANWSRDRNLLDNGDMFVDIRGTGTQSCGQNSGVAATNYAADRFACSANVASGAGQMSVATSTPTPPLGFTNESKVWRNSGALTQPVCQIQEVPTFRATMLQGRPVIFSAFVQALAGLNADNGNAFNMYIFTGTGSDQGLGSFTASPAITPAWTNIATLAGAAQTATTSWARYNTGVINIPITVTEVAVAICFTPTATGAGATDGLASVGWQLEAVDLNSTAGPSYYEFKNPVEEIAEAQRYAYALPEAASGVAQFNANATAATTCEAVYQFPVPMRAAPTLSQIGTAIAGGTTYKANSAAAGLTNVSAMATKTANSVNAASITFTSAGMTAGQACTIEGLGGGAIPMWSADF